MSAAVMSSGMRSSNTFPPVCATKPRQSGGLEMMAMQSTEMFVLINDLTDNDKIDYNVEHLKAITKNHWRSSDQYKHCANKKCGKEFSILNTHHHCRKCGEVFCKGCVQYKRRLNKLASFDPEGKAYKVCKTCFIQGQYVEGQSYNHTSDFLAFRRAKVQDDVDSTVTKNTGTDNLNSRFELEAECDRLIDGFANSIGTSEVFKTLHDLKKVVVTPEWMNSTWKKEKISSTCRLCRKSFGLLKKKHFCRVCGGSVCSDCSTKDLLIYIPNAVSSHTSFLQGIGNNNNSNKDTPESCLPKLAVINVPGCPDVEPEVSLYLRVCTDCQLLMSKRQVRLEEESEDSVSPSTTFFQNMIRVNIKFLKAEERVREHLPKFKQIIKSLDDKTKKSHEKSNIKVLAKVQEDLSDALVQHVSITQQLKGIRPVTDTQAVHLKLYTKAKGEFYLEHMSEFGRGKHKLGESVPDESLDFVQREMDQTIAKD